jgi:hypothetical protein
MRATLTGRIVLALIANRFYALHGVRPGDRVSAIAPRLTLGKVFRSGPNTWYVLPGRISNGVLKVRHGVVLEVGIANRQLIGHRAAERALLRSF